LHLFFNPFHSFGLLVVTHNSFIRNRIDLIIGRQVCKLRVDKSPSNGNAIHDLSTAPLAQQLAVPVGKFNMQISMLFFSLVPGKLAMLFQSQKLCQIIGSQLVLEQSPPAQTARCHSYCGHGMTHIDHRVAKSSLTILPGFAPVDRGKSKEHCSFGKL
jgi:hypothetical protein